MQALKNLALVSQIGFTIITPILLGVYIGTKLDKWLKTSAIFLTIFIVMGVISGFLNAYKIIAKLNFDKEEKENGGSKDEK